MMPFFSFSFIDSDSNGRKKFRAVWFLTKATISGDDLQVYLDQYYAENPIPDQLDIVSPNYNSKSICRATLDSGFLSRVRTVSGDEPSTVVKIIEVNYQGNAKYLEPRGENWSRKNVPEKEWSHLVQRGAFHIFRHRDGMLPKSDFQHYVKPSQKRVDQFIRAGNTLVSTVETEFLALSILHKVKDNTEIIYVDSHTITSFAQSLVLLRNRMRKSHLIYPEVKSYESYRGFDNESFAGIRNGIVIVSASSGGKMLRDLEKKKGIPADRIATIYFLGDEEIPGTVVCDLTHSQSNPEGYENVRMSVPGDSAFFPRHSLPIYIEPEGFFPNSSRVEQVVLKEVDLPKWHVDLGEFLLGYGAVSCNAVNMRRSGHGGSVEKLSLAIDLMPLFTDSCSQLSLKLEDFLNRCLPATVSRIIAMPDDMSHYFSSAVSDFIEKVVGIRPNVVTVPEYLATLGGSSDGGMTSGYSLVVSGTMATGDTLMEVSQCLRNDQENNGIGYLIGVTRCESKDDLARIRSNLWYSDCGFRNYLFESLSDFYFPPERHDRSSIWGDEYDHYMEMLELGLSREERELLNSRIKTITQKQGMTEDVFLVSTGFVPLRLRANSMFTNKLSHNRPMSQADVLCMVSCWFHYLRRKEILGQNPLRRRVLDPNNFFRFNDGVIQAAILRAADHGELSFTSEPNISARMRNVLIRIFCEGSSSPRSEALAEVLLALSMDRIRLCTPDMKLVCDRLSAVVTRLPSPCIETILFRSLSRRVSRITVESPRPDSVLES